MKKLSSASALLLACVTAAGFAPPPPTSCQVFQSALTGQMTTGKTEDGRPALVLDTRVFGDLEGHMTLIEVGDKAVFGELRGGAVFETADGVILTEDVIQLIPSKGKTVEFWLGEHRIIGGSGAYSNASGWMESTGTVASEGIKLRLEGVICVPTKDGPVAAPGFGE